MLRLVATAASTQGGRASSRLDHGSKNQAACAGSQLIQALSHSVDFSSGFWDEEMRLGKFVKWSFLDYSSWS